MLKLPPVEPFRARTESDWYGASCVAARYAGVRFPTKPIRGSWQHGWGPDYWLVHPYLLFGTLNASKRNVHFWAAKKKDEAYLKEHGYRNVKAIGLPIVYLPRNKFERIPNSLLVMPVHSLDYTTHDHWKFAEYAQQINQIRHQFSQVLVCIHPSCLRKGYWVDDFKRLDFEIVEGARGDDRNAFFRLQALMSSFECVTTNGFGSHLAYASYFGAKVSIFGTFAEYKVEDHKDTPFYNRYPELLGTAIRLSSEEVLRQHLPEFFCQPKEVRQKVAWAHDELGHDNRVSPEEMIDLFAWRPTHRVVYALTCGSWEKIFRSCERLKVRIKHVVRRTAVEGNLGS